MRLAHENCRCTAARFGGSGKCMWGCDAPDCIRHYAQCQCLWNMARRRLRLNPPVYREDKTLAFLGLHMKWTTGFQAEAVRNAILRYAAYRAHNAWRTSGKPTPAGEGFFRQAVIESVKGHQEAAKILDTTWLQTHGR